MLTKIFGTFITKILTVGIGFLIVVLTTNELGIVGRGEISLMLLNISIIGIIQGVFNGSSLIFLTPKHNQFLLFIISTFSSILIGIGFSFLLWSLSLVEKNHLSFLILLTLFQGLLTTSQSLLIGRGEIAKFNYLEIFKTILLLVFLLVTFYILKIENVTMVYWGYFISYILPFLLSCFWIVNKLNNSTIKSRFNELMIESIKYGTQIQLNNISQMINYRFSFFILQKLKGKAELGVFSIAISLAESIWIFTISITTYQFSKLVNTSNKKEQIRITLLSLNLIFFGTIFLLGILLLLPQNLFDMLFGDGVKSIKFILIALALGILELSYFTIINHYFTGIGKNKINIYASLIGNALTIVGCYLLIPYFGAIGAGIVASISYFAMLLYLIYKFKQESQVHFKSLIPSLYSIKAYLQLTKSKQIN
jgi:O-antigen/teichoic acid export membrane protein